MSSSLASSLRHPSPTNHRHRHHSMLTVATLSVNHNAFTLPLIALPPLFIVVSPPPSHTKIHCCCSSLPHLLIHSYPRLPLPISITHNQRWWISTFAIYYDVLKSNMSWPITVAVDWFETTAARWQLQEKGWQTEEGERRCCYGRINDGDHRRGRVFILMREKLRWKEEMYYDF